MINIYRKSYIIGFSVFFLLIVGFGLVYLLNSKQAFDELLAYYDNQSSDISENPAFLTEIPLINGYNQGEVFNCWYLGQTKRNYNKIYYFKDKDGNLIESQLPIINTIPGESNYSNFWKIYYVQAPKNYEINGIKSLASLESAINADLFKRYSQGVVKNMVVVSRDLNFENYNNISQFEVFYNGYQVKMLDFNEPVLILNNLVDPSPVVVFKKEGADYPLFENFVQKDLDGDGKLSKSFNVYDFKKGDQLYSPLHQINYVYVNEQFPNIGEEAVWTSFEDVIENKGGYINLEKGNLGLEEINDYYNCPQAF